MSLNSLYLYALENGSGSLISSMGLMKILKKNIKKVAFFRPIIICNKEKDYDIEFITKYFNIDIDYEDSYGYTINQAKEIVLKDGVEALLKGIFLKFKKLQNKFDFILCEGIKQSLYKEFCDFDINLDIAKNFSSPIINLINAHNLLVEDIITEINVYKRNFKENKNNHFATIVNMVKKEDIEKLSKEIEQKNVFFLPKVDELLKLSLADIINSKDFEAFNISEIDYTRRINNIKIAALSLDNFLEKIEAEDLGVLPADRSEIILGIIGMLFSTNYPNISGLVFSYNSKPHKNIKKLLDGIDFKIPILITKDDTYNSATNISKIEPKIRLNDTKKISLAFGVFFKYFPSDFLEDKLSESITNVTTPLMFEYKIFEMAKKDKKKIILPESNDTRILQAAEIILHQEIADIVFVVDSYEEFYQNYKKLGLHLEKAEILNKNDEKLKKEFADEFYKLRKQKGLTYQGAFDSIGHVNYFATMAVYLEYADGMVSGASHSTAETIRPALQIIKTKKGIDLVSSIFFMCLENEVLVYGDCAINQNPTAKELAQIAISSAQNANKFGINPKVAMLSYSTGDSGSGDDVIKVKEALKIVKELMPDLVVDGPMQYDAAVDKEVAKKKMPNSKVAGEANVLIFPDLNTGNNTYKAVQRSTGAIAIGPILQGLKKPINDLSRGCLVKDIVNTIAITAIQAN